MKSFDGRASSIVAAAPEECFTLIAAIDDYPRWNPDLVRDVYVLERDSIGRPATVQMTIHVAESPFGKDFDLRLAVLAEAPRSVSLTRIVSGPSDHTELTLQWEITPADRTRIDLTFHARTPLVPSFVPLPDVGGEIARRLVDGAVQALSGGRSQQRTA